MQKIGLEWFWRIMEDPILWRRYAADAIAFAVLLATRVIPYALYLSWRRAARDFGEPVVVEVEEASNESEIRLAGPWHAHNLSPLRKCFSRVAAERRNVILNLGGVTYIDSAFVALIVLLQGHQKLNQRTLTIVDAGVSIKRVIRYCCAEYLHLTPV
jgi:N-acetylglucosaminyldiphosphoundecaprenol N-acetyl-beta-D-mannosaminyltransferase